MQHREGSKRVGKVGAWGGVSAGLAALCVPLCAAPARAGISGVCPDGSIYIVQRAEQIPCSSSKQVEPGELPPLRGEYLPRPYGWELHQRRQDQNNPYNLVDLAPSVRHSDGGRARATDREAPEAGRAEAPQQAAPRETARADAGAAGRASAPQAGRVAVSEAFAAEELGDLLQIVELSQASAPARFAPESEGVAIDLARSPAFEEALAERGASPRGPVVLFAARAERAAASFRGQLTFVQGHRAYYPDAADPSQLGVLSGALGELRPGEALLGYVVLPSDYDPSQEMEIFWHDRQLHATLSPGA